MFKIKIMTATMEIATGTMIAAMNAIACRMVRTDRLAATSMSKATDSMPGAREEITIGGTRPLSTLTAAVGKSQTLTVGWSAGKLQMI